LNHLKKQIIIHAPLLIFFYIGNKFSETYFLTTSSDIGMRLATTVQYIDKIIQLHPFISWHSYDLLTGILSAVLFKIIIYLKQKKCEKT